MLPISRQLTKQFTRQFTRLFSTQKFHHEDMTSVHERQHFSFKALRKQEVLAVLSKPTGSIIGEVDDDGKDVFHTSIFAGKVVTDEMKESIKLLLDIGIDPGDITAPVFHNSVHIMKLKVQILREYHVKINLLTLLKFNCIIGSSLNRLHKLELMEDPPVAVRKIINDLPINEEDKSYLTSHLSFRHDHVGCYSLTCLCYELVNAYLAHRLGSHLKSDLNNLYTKKFRRLHDTIRLISLISSSNALGDLKPIGLNKFITHGNPELIQFFLDNPSYLHGLPFNLIFRTPNLLNRSPERLVESMNTYFNKLEFKPQTIDSLEVFTVPSDEMIERSEFWFKYFGKKQVTTTPKSSKLIYKFEQFKYKYSTIRHDDLSENPTEFDDINLLVRSKPIKISKFLEPLYAEYNWNFKDVKKRLNRELMSELLKIEPEKLKFEDSRAIANYLLNEMKFTNEQASSSPAIFGLPLETVKDMCLKFKQQIESPEWRYHPLVLDYVLYSYFNADSDIGRAFGGQQIDDN